MSLISSESQHKYVRALFEQIVPFGPDLLFFEAAASSQHLRGDVVDGGLQGGAGGLGDTIEVLLWYPACAENASVCEPLSS